MIYVVMPQMCESIVEGTLTKWLKKPGDHVERDEPLFEISTDKVDAEIPAPSAGVLKEIKVTEGQTVPIQTVVAVIDVAGAAAAAAPAAPPTVPAPEKPAAPKASPAPPASATPAAPPRVGGNGQKIRSSPLVRKLAKEHNVDLAALEGSGAGGRISKKDILAAASSGGAKPAAAPSAAPPSVPPSVPPAAGGAVVHPVLENAVPRE